MIRVITAALLWLLFFRPCRPIDDCLKPTVKLTVGENSRGIMMCSGEGLMVHTIAVIRQIKKLVLPNSDTIIGVAHCTELSQSSQTMLMSEGAAFVTDICDCRGAQQRNSSTSIKKEKRPRKDSFFCKTEALLRSPFRHTMLVDHDVIWLQNPDRLWNAPGYVRTGALYFLDR